MKSTQVPAPKSPTVLDLCESLSLVVHAASPDVILAAPGKDFDPSGDVLARLAESFRVAGYPVIVSEVPGITGPSYRVEIRYAG